MNDKQQLAAMGEHMAEQPLCMAKRIEELEAQVRVMAGLLREARPYMDHRGGAGVKGYTQLAKEIDATLSGKLPAPVAPEGWQLVPVVPTKEMCDSALRIPAKGDGMARDFMSSTGPVHDLLGGVYRAMLAAAPKQDPKP